MDCVSVAGSDAVSDGTKRNASDIGTSGTAGRPTVSVDTIEDATEDATGEAESNSASTERRCSSGSDSRQRIAPDSKWTPAAQLAPSLAFFFVGLRPSHATHTRTPRTRRAHAQRIRPAHSNTGQARGVHGPAAHSSFDSAGRYS